MEGFKPFEVYGGGGVDDSPAGLKKSLQGIRAPASAVCPNEISFRRIDSSFQKRSENIRGAQRCTPKILRATRVKQVQ